MVYLDAIDLKGLPRENAGFPFSLPLIHSLPELRLSQPVTFFVGENGSGKSTLLEAIAAGIPLPTIGSQEFDRDEAMEPARLLANDLRYKWRKKTRHGFFLRAEDFFNFGARVKGMITELDAQYREYKAAYEERPFADGLRMAIGSTKGQMNELLETYGEDLNARSHGESFLKLFQSRITPNGLYLLDEPEAPLSPLRQLAMLSLLMEKVEAGCQFIIATHSPILMAFPHATIYSFDQLPVQAVEYDELDHVTLTRDFLNNPSAYLRRL